MVTKEDIERVRRISSPIDRDLTFISLATLLLKERDLIEKKYLAAREVAIGWHYSYHGDQSSPKCSADLIDAEISKRLSTQERK